jgi:murein DD-endopeptidase MepM/ murein hydrolase activator NlpD
VRTRLGVLGVLLGASVTVLVTSTVPSSATEPAPQTDPAVSAQLAVVHSLAADRRAAALRQAARTRQQVLAARDRARQRVLLARVRELQRQQRWTTPVRGYTLSAGFGDVGAHWESGHHTGQDFVVPYGTTVRSAHAGTVTFAGWGDRFGNLVEITHDGGVETWYAHLSRLDVALGATVATGQPIGATGCTGNCFGTHLHFEVHLGHDVAVDPLTWFRLRGVRV